MCCARSLAIQCCKAPPEKTDGAVVKRVNPVLPRHLVILCTCLLPLSAPLSCSSSVSTEDRGPAKIISVHISVQGWHVRATFTLCQDDPQKTGSGAAAAWMQETEGRGEGSWGGEDAWWGWVKSSRSDDAGKSFELCRNLICIAPHSVQVQSLPHPTARLL